MISKGNSLVRPPQHSFNANLNLSSASASMFYTSTYNDYDGVRNLEDDQGLSSSSGSSSHESISDDVEEDICYVDHQFC